MRLFSLSYILTHCCHIKPYIALFSVHAVHFYDFIDDLLLFVYTLKKVFLYDFACFVEKLRPLSNVQGVILLKILCVEKIVLLHTARRIINKISRRISGDGKVLVERRLLCVIKVILRKFV